ncbi:hypothetical protein HCEG_05729 [Histoplasma capsulatum var. duboisii H88]|uniref:Uncharacterized protein n=1 Tax=Ajellomyces capsulatus (strain H88) TaxID=544711 RepID=F0UJ69_AJEC8|nr:hypothetical protein HCEG_05729 [Histoplasma capsulatum var. duboisii H88]QSS57137.1 hypothetical protein I7I53_05541 [Histoplasma capsulatum var. duboisii H88]
MPPDINSLPPSRSTSHSPYQARTFANSAEIPSGQSLSPRSSSTSLAAAATMNATDRSRRSSVSANRGSPHATRVHERRRSTVAMNLNLNDPTLPGPGELSSSDYRSSIGSSYRTHSPTSIGGNPTIATGDPHHQRTPSLGEIHQELEEEQEAQVNRLLQMIRIQQAQLQRQQQQQFAASGTAIVDDSTPTSERSVSFPPVPAPPPTHRSSTQIPSSLSRRRSSGHSPAIPSHVEPETGILSADWSSIGGDGSGRHGSRDETSYYQAETAMLTRENQMLRVRIRELERQVAELSSSAAHTPSTSSRLSNTEAVPPTPARIESEESSQTPQSAEDVEKP